MHTDHQSLVAREHVALRAAIAAVDASLVELDHPSPPPEEPSPTPRPDQGAQERWANTGNGAEPVAAPEEPRRRRIHSLGGLRAAWATLREAMLAHLEREERVIPPLLALLASGQLEREEAVTTIESLMDEHERLHVLATGVRAALVGAGPVRSDFLHALDLFHRHAAKEDASDYPELLAKLQTEGDVDEATVLERYRDGVDVTRGMRGATRPEEPPPGGFFAWIKRIFGR